MWKIYKFYKTQNHLKALRQQKLRQRRN